MNRASKYALIAIAVVLAVAVVGGAAFAAAGPKAVRPAPTALSEGEKQTLEQLRALKKQHMERFQAERKALIEQAVKEGKITQERADKLLQFRKGTGFRHGHSGMGPGKMGLKAGPHSAEKLKAWLKAEVEAGRLTQEQADAMLKRWEEKVNQAR